MQSTLTRSKYWRRLAIVAAEIIILAACIVFLWPSLASIWQLDADTAAIIPQIVIIINALVVTPLLLLWLSQRARDIGNAQLWSFIGIVVPCGLIIVGCMPSQTSV